MTIGGRVFEHRRRFHLLGASSRIPSARERRDTVWWRRRYVDVLDRREDRRLRRFGRLCRKSRKRIRLFDQRQGSAASMVMAYIGKQKGHLNLFVDFFASLNEIRTRIKQTIIFCCSKEKSTPPTPHGVLRESSHRCLTTVYAKRSHRCLLSNIVERKIWGKIEIVEQKRIMERRNYVVGKGVNIVITNHVLRCEYENL